MSRNYDFSDSQERQMSDFARMRRDPAFFVFGEGNRHFCLTYDELARKNYVPFPRFYYLLISLHVLEKEDRLLMPKSRQMMFTWLNCAYALWCAMFKEAQTIGIQSLREDLSKFHLKNKVLYIYNALPPWIRAQCPIEPTEKILTFPKTNSKIIAFQQGEAAIRGFTLSLLINDEMQSQPLAREAFAAALPTMIGAGKKTGKCVGVGTAMDGTYFKELVLPNDNRYRDLSRGVKFKRNPSNGFCVLRVHYTADPSKNDEWVRLNRPVMGENKWNREMEINFDTAAGNPYFPEFQPMLMKRRGLRPIPGLPLIRGWDFGRTSPACVVEQYNPAIRQVAAIKEFTLMGGNIWQLGDAVTQFCKNAFPGYDFIDYGDIAGGHASDTSDVTAIQVLGSPPYNIPMIARKWPESQGHDIFRKWLLMTPDRLEPGFIVDFEGCPILCSGLEGAFTYRETDNAALADKYVKVHPMTDIMDAHKYIYCNDPELSIVYGDYPIPEQEKSPEYMTPDEYKDWYFEKVVVGNFGKEIDYSQTLQMGVRNDMAV